MWVIRGASVAGQMLKGQVAQRLVQPSPHTVLVRLTSGGPPPAKPVVPNSFSAHYDEFVSRWPKIYTLKCLIAGGVRWCFADVKMFFPLRWALMNKKRKLSELSMPELEVLVQNPVELPRLAFVMSLLPFPFTFYIIGLAIIFFPRIFLTRHFWSNDQRREFFQIEITESLSSATQMFECIGGPADISDLRLPANIGDLKPDQVSSLCKLHGVLPLPGRVDRLSRRADALKELDKLLATNINSLTTQQLYFHMYIRRLNYDGKNDNDMRNILKLWIKYAARLNNSVYLFAPIFIKKT